MESERIFLVYGIIEYNTKFKERFHDKLFEFKNVSVMSYYDSNMAAIAYSGIQYNEDDDSFVKRAGYFEIEKSFIFGISGKDIFHFVTGE